jgi:hypothetical protein
MIRYTLAFLLLLSAFQLSAQGNPTWKTETRKDFDIAYTAPDDSIATIIIADLELGIEQVTTYFEKPFRKKFKVHLYPNREALNAAWRKLWNEPTFTSECWMVASGDVYDLHILTPRVWKKEACEHDPANREKLSKLVIHELVHVYHGQFTSAPTLGELEAVAWFVEGLATRVSGQLDAKRLNQVKQLIAENKNATELENFWSGQARYGQSGYMIAYIEKLKGKKFLIELLSLTDETSILTKLGMSESELIAGWKVYVGGL